jgi:hypothetical protein
MEWCRFALIGDFVALTGDNSADLPTANDQYSITPPLRYSTTPPLQYSTTPGRLITVSLITDYYSLRSLDA